MGGFEMIGSLLQGEASKKAARTQADALIKSQEMVREAADEAKGEILDRYVPALGEYRAGIQDAQTQIADGTADIMRILGQTTANADMMLAQTGIDAERALMGSTASSQGMSMVDFNNQYQTIQAAPPTARREMTNNFQQALQQQQARDDAAAAAGAGAEGGPATGYADTSPLSARDRSNEQYYGSEGNILGGNVPQDPVSLAQQAVANDPMLSEGNRAALTEASLRRAAAEGSVPGGITTQPVSRVPLEERQSYEAAAPVSAPAMSTEGIGFAGAMGNLQSGYDTAQSALDASIAQSRADVTGQTSQALQQLAETRESGLGRYQPYSEAGQAAIGREASLSGAMGHEAQQQAIDAYIESPGQQYLREQQERSLLRNQAAIGGLGGGNVRTALQEQAMGIASTQQQQYLENLRSLATRGQQVAGAEANIIGQTGLAGAQITQDAGPILAQLSQQYGISSSNLAQLTSSQMAQLAQQTGMQVADLRKAVGAARAGLQTELGSGLASAQAAGTSALADLTQTSASAGLTSEQNVATMLANLATGAGSSIAGLEAARGSSLAAGDYLQGQAWGSALSGLGQSASSGWNTYQDIRSQINANNASTTPTTTAPAPTTQAPAWESTYMTT